ncbi:hypothetical protein GE09DRAFT_1210374 [Coniochaeta sp. 2T2.1]|nr:hypothetical protein GE09DRAFT_1210374 [Coniochaeta sp. 2T2.1]
MADQRMTWDHEADKDLLGCIVDELGPSQPQLRGVMERMHAHGHTWTLKAITQHLQKLRKKEGGDGAAGAAGNGTPKTAATPKTPRKRAPAKPKDGTKTPASKGKRKSEAVAKQDDDDDEMDDIPLSSKKLKSEPSVSDNSMDSFIKFDEDDDAGAV